METSPEQIVLEDRSLKIELASMKKQLESLTFGQAALERVISQVHKDVGTLVSNGHDMAASNGSTGRAKPKLEIQIPPKDTGTKPAKSKTPNAMDDDGGADETPMETPKTANSGWKSESSAEESSAKTRKSMSFNNQRMEDRRIRRLVKMFDTAESMQKSGGKRAGPQSHVHAQMFGAVKNSWIDICITFVILANAVFIGLQVGDEESNEKWNVWMIMDLVCSFLFWAELTLKLCLRGFREHFMGPDKYFNIFDFCLVMLDTVQQILSLAFEKQANAKIFALVRIIRLVRLAKILRVLRTEYFKNLLSMVHGMVGGIGTLGWSVMLFFLLLYVMSVLCVDIFQASEHKLLSEHFGSMGRAMFTVFRCSFGDCNTLGGTPIPEFIGQYHGWAYALIYCGFMFFVCVGVFNVIAAIFVDATLQAATELALKRQHERLCDEKLWSWHASTLVKLLVERAQPKDAEQIDMATPAKMAEHVHDMLGLEVSRSVIDDLTTDEKAVSALLSLEIDVMDHKRLSDILDPDHSGTIDIIEFTNGLTRLRGQPRRSDIITIDLMVRNLQEKTDEILEGVKSLACEGGMVESMAAKLSDMDACPGTAVNMKFGHHAI